MYSFLVEELPDVPGQPPANSHGISNLLFLMLQRENPSLQAGRVVVQAPAPLSSAQPHPLTSHPGLAISGSSSSSGPQQHPPSVGLELGAFQYWRVCAWGMEISKHYSTTCIDPKLSHLEAPRPASHSATTLAGTWLAPTHGEPP